jgi:hypothetical protein
MVMTGHSASEAQYGSKDADARGKPGHDELGI